jgi:hypothetical protein
MRRLISRRCGCPRIARTSSRVIPTRMLERFVVQTASGLEQLATKRRAPIAMRRKNPAEDVLDWDAVMQFSNMFAMKRGCLDGAKMLKNQR